MLNPSWDAGQGHKIRKLKKIKSMSQVSDFLWQKFARLLKEKQDFFEKFPKQSSHLEEESYEIAKISGRF